jgi:hypothetical protein
MNKHILMVIDHQLNPEKYTQEQLEDNRKAAYDAADEAADAYDAAAAAAYDAADAAADAYDAAAAAAAYDATTAAAADEAAAAKWVDIHFERSGENKQDYVDKINKESQS